MKFKTVLLLGAFLSLLSMVACTMRSHTEPELTVDNAVNLGQAIFINQTTDRPNGVEEIHINEGDTLKLQLTTALLKPPSYVWTPKDGNVVKFIKDENDPTLFYAVALGDSGVTTTVELKDVGNQAVKTLDVIIEKHWADPLYFDFIKSLNGHYYYISLNKKTWVQAEVICREAGGYLATIQTGEENTLLKRGMGQEENVWIGIRFVKEGEKWTLNKWATGEPLEYENFNGKPSDPGIFAEYYFFMDINGKWENWHEISYAYFLEME